MNDGQLLCRYVRDGDDPAFRELVHRHLDMVHATAARRLGDPHAAEDVSQAVFCLLVRKAAGLFDLADLGGWLHRAACWKASEHERAERRRRIREQASATPGELMMPPSPDEVWHELAPVLDATLDRLDDGDRQLILWRFYRRRSLKEIGSDLKLSEDAARMRVNRAVERLRRLLAPSVSAAWAGAASATRAGSSLEALLAERAADPAPNQLAARVIAAASKVVTEPHGSWGEALRARVAHLGWRQAGIGLGAAVGVALTVWRVADPGAEARPEAGAAPTTAAASTTPAATPTETSPQRNLLASTRVPGEGTSPDAASDLEARLAPLWRILKSTVPDRTHPPQDLRDCISGLADRPDAVLDALSWAIADPTASLATRERAVWGLWLLGEATPALHSRIVAIAADLIAGEQGPMRWHASEVLRHLSTPEGAVGAVAVALQSRPDAWEATKTFWESAANRRPNEVREVVGPWLRRDDVLRFLAAAVLARLPDAKSAELAPILLESVPVGSRQDVALRGLSALGPSAREFAPRL
ncbi:MAG: sigma-70 family RNA polymerase sigma factor, partial [Verrucomicrobiales bacterium]|nr:sigma-70 family RNA polymerase sigma factor [Verrucomicrobiales bacterium]